MQEAYTLLGADWRETPGQWKEAGHQSPPVMLTVCNRTETAARVEHYFNKGARALARTARARTDACASTPGCWRRRRSARRPRPDKDYEARLQEIVEAARMPETARSSCAA